jgi:acetylornithine/succinyldiaminopimelate/putrescine aminotransferase
LIFDEVQTGLGRTGKMFGYEHFGVVPDVMTLAKTLGGGFPIGACLARGKAGTTFEPGDHAATFGGNPLAATAAIAAVTAIQEEGMVENARDTGGYFQKKLKALKAKRKDVADIRGLGLMLALEFSEPIAKTLSSRCLDMGLIVNPIGDNILRFVPPLNLTKEQVDSAVSIIEAALVEP